MLRSILIGLDGSVFSSTATQLGIEWARHYEALLVGLGIVNEPAIRQPEAVPLGVGHFKQDRDESLLVRERHRIDQILEQFALECAQAGVAYKLLEEVGAAYEQLLLQAQSYDCWASKPTLMRKGWPARPCTNCYGSHRAPSSSCPKNSGTAMPDLNVSEQDARDIAAYLYRPTSQP